MYQFLSRHIGGWAMPASALIYALVILATLLFTGEPVGRFIYLEY